MSEERLSQCEISFLLGAICAVSAITEEIEQHMDIEQLESFVGCLDDVLMDRLTQEVPLKMDEAIAEAHQIIEGS